MQIRIQNQKPATLYDKPFEVLPVIDPALPAADFTDALNQHIRTMYVDPMFEPIVPGTDVSIEDVTDPNNPISISADAVQSAVTTVWMSPTLDVQLENQLGEIYRQGIRYHAQNNWYFEEQVGVEALSRAKLPLPDLNSTRIVQYTADADIVPAAKAFLGNLTEVEANHWFANLVGFTHPFAIPNLLIATVQNSQVWEMVKQDLAQMQQLLGSNISTDTMLALNAVQKISLTNDLSTGLFLPSRGLANPMQADANSFTRLFMHVLAQAERGTSAHVTTPGMLTIQPTNLRQVVLPENILVINLENYAHATGKDIRNDWKKLTRALNHQKAMSFITNKNLLTAAVVDRNMKKIQSAAAMSSAQQQSVMRARARMLSSKPISSSSMLRRMAQVARSRITHQQTQNTYKSVKRSFMRANRRQPSNANLPGKMQVTKYRPDLHAYIDTSGSISEEHYRDAIMNLIALARKIDCNLYITSWSDVISETALVKTKGRSKQDAYRQFLAVPKVTGGTEMENVWLKIDRLDELNKKRGKSYQLNFVITDFEYYLNRDRRFSPSDASVRNTFYVPISTDQASWTYMKKSAEAFRDQVEKAGDPGVWKRLLM